MQFINTVHWIKLQPRTSEKVLDSRFLKSGDSLLTSRILMSQTLSEVQGWFHPVTVLNQPFKDIIKITLLYQYCIVRKLYGKDNFKCLMPPDEDTTDNAAKAYGYASCCNYSVCIHIRSATTYQPFKVLCQIFYI